MRLDDRLNQNVLEFMHQHGPTIEAVLNRYVATQNREAANSTTRRDRDRWHGHAQEIEQIRIQLSELNDSLP